MSKNEFFVHLVVTRASVKLTLGNNDEKASDQLTLLCRLDLEEQKAFESHHPDFARPDDFSEIASFTLNIYSSESILHLEHTNMRTTIADGMATVNILDRPDDIALASRYFADFGRTDQFKADVHFRVEGRDYVPLAVDLTLSRGLGA